MKLFKHKKNDRKESIKTKAEQATAVLLTKIFQKFGCLLYTSPSPRDVEESRMPSSA